MGVLVEPWKTLAGDILNRRPAVVGLLELHSDNPDLPFWDQSARNALAGDSEAQRVLAQVAMRAMPILRDVEATVRDIKSRSAIIDGGAERE